MTTAPPKHARGKHAKPSSGIAVRWNRLVKRTSPGEPGRRRMVAAATGTGSVALLAVAAVVGLSATDSRQAPRAETAAQSSPRKGPAPAVQPLTEPAGDPDDVSDALPYLEGKDPEKKTVRHIKKISRSGDFVRVYTDLGEDDENSRPAVDLCEWTTDFLEDGGETSPRVFVHAQTDDNGEVVVANRQSDKDGCEVED